MKQDRQNLFPIGKFMILHRTDFVMKTIMKKAMP